ncbi:SusC/RagA family TonB-linked outer membrane protein [Niastella vici]|nr:SusC/RagA family TonB-linked outer membrane protein [Niastella vici]
MKLTSILLLAACLQVSAKGYAQRVTISGKHMPLQQVFKEITKQTGYYFIYKEKWTPEFKNVDVLVKNASIEQALELCFSNQPFTYSIIEKTVVLKPKSPVKADEIIVTEAPVIDIKGIVTSENGPVAGANVIIKRTGKGTSTAANGQFKLEDAIDDDVLVVSCIGYETQTVPLKDKKGFVFVQLKVAVNKLDEVQILSYGGATTRRLSTGSVTKVTSEDIQRSPVTNVLQALAGRTTGMSISQANGLPGGDVFFQVRGQNSVSANDFTSAPLLIIDGMPYPNTPINLSDVTGVSNSIGASSPIGYGSPLYNLNPRDIESVEILKDADATAIYGSRAANGVMLITTKKGKQGKTKFEVNAYTGVALDTRRVDVLSTPEYLALRREAFKNAGITPTAANAIDLFKWDTTRSTDWQQTLLGHTAQTTDATVSMSGGAGGTSFLVSGNYRYENTIYPDRRGSAKAGAHFSLNHTSASGRFNIALSAMVNSVNIKLPGGDYGFFAFDLPPHFQPYDTAGNLTWDWTGGNPYGAMKTSYSSKTFSVTSNLQLRYTLLKGLDAKVAIGYTRVQGDQQLISPKAAANPANISSSNSLNISINQTLNVEPQLQYTGNIASGKLTLLAGSTVMKNIAEMPFNVIASGFASDAYINNLALAGTYQIASGYNAYQYASFFGRANYNWDNKYILNGSFRRDGSSRFGANRRFGDFGAIGAAWLFSNEDFGRNLSFLSFGKLRGSVGWVGSDNVPNYKFLPTYSPTLYRYADLPGLAPTQLENPDFGWEATSKLEGALELGFLKDRILLSAAWYRNRTGNQLVQFPVSGQTGFNSYTANLTDAVVQNTGWEFELNTTNVQTKNVKWTTSFNISLPRNKLVKFQGIENSAYTNSLVVGKPLNSLFAVPFTGVDAAGKPTYEDLNKNGTIDFFGLAAYGKGDLAYIGKTAPNAFGGLNNSISYKNFQLDFLLQYTYGLKKKNFLVGHQPGTFTNVPRKAVEGYRSRGLDNAFFRPTLSNDWFYYAYFSSATYTDASFIRLNNVALSYNLAGNTLRKLHMAGARVYLQAQNLFVISRYDGFDPESGVKAVPPLLRLAAGIQCSF